jgi:hypothetical protein
MLNRRTGTNVTRPRPGRLSEAAASLQGKVGVREGGG